MVARLHGRHWKNASTSPMTTHLGYAISPFDRVAGTAACRR
jgi:hypothetical protein